ncbi:MAG: LysR family transcriptional regulator, partial [Sulfuricella sp.]|nr:LysR family transcriptional regulator [Sulfuricella sp.]
RIRPRITGEFDDGALMTAFGQAGVGIFAAPTAIAEQVMRQHEVVSIGATEEVIEQFYAISVERKLTHPAVVAISRAARQELFIKRQPGENTSG